MNKPMPETLFHYTSLDALVGGIISKDNICLWASHSQYLNDKSEIKIGKEHINKLKAENQTDTNNQYNYALPLNSEDIYILSLSNTQDSLPMWSMYGKNGKGISLELLVDKVKTNYGLNEVKPARCIYSNYPHDVRLQQLKSLLSYTTMDVEIMNNPLKPHGGPLEAYNIRKSSLFRVTNGLYEITISDIIWKLPMIMKHESFRYEDEYRMCFPKAIFDQSKIKYRVSNNIIIPYMETIFPKEVLKAVWIGPTQDPERSNQSLRLFLDAMGFNHTEIKISTIPYRG